MYKYFLLIALILCSFSVSAQWQQTGSKVRYVNGIGIPTKDTAAGVLADSSQILIRPADSSLYVKYKRTWQRVGSGGTIAGSGTTNRVPKFTGSTIIGNSSIADSASSLSMTISPSGNLGINTTSPSASYRLTLNGDASLNTGGIIIRQSGTDVMYIGNIIASNTTDFEFWNPRNGYTRFATNNIERMRITSGGNVGIGSYTSPAAKFVVDGTSLINTNTDNGVDKLQVNGNIYSSGTIKSGTTTTNGLEILTGAGKGIIMNTTTTGSQDQMRLTFQQNGTDKAMWYYSDFANNCFMGTITAEDLVFASNNSNALWVKGSTQNVLINNSGSDNGTDKLQVAGSLSATGMKQNYVTKTGAYTATDSDYVIDCTSGTFTITLPASSGRTGRILIIKNSGAGTITVDGNAAETIDGAATYSLAVQYATIQIVSDGTNWKIISKF